MVPTPSLRFRRFLNKPKLPPILDFISNHISHRDPPLHSLMTSLSIFLGNKPIPDRTTTLLLLKGPDLCDSRLVTEVRDFFEKSCWQKSLKKLAGVTPRRMECLLTPASPERLVPKQEVHVSQLFFPPAHFLFDVRTSAKLAFASTFPTSSSHAFL